MKIHNHNLNIHYTAPKEVWKKLSQIYSEMPYWYGFVGGSPQWYGQENDGKIIEASIEPSELQFYGNLPQDEWDIWFELI